MDAKGGIMMCKLKGQMDKGGLYDVQMKRRMEKRHYDAQIKRGGCIRVNIRWKHKTWMQKGAL